MDYNNQENNNQIPTTQPQVNPEVAGTDLNMSKRSRLNKHLERQGKRNLIISILGILVIFFILIRFGIPFIADLGFLSSQIASKKSNTSSQDNSKSTFLSVPTLNPTFDATNSAKVNISGSTISGKQVAIYLNGSIFKKISIHPDGTFSQDIILSDGENIIKAKSINDKKESDFSDPLTIALKNSSPTLSIDSVHDGDTVNKSPINISGKTDPDVKVTVNGFWAIVDSQGGYSYNLNLQNADNQVIVDAIDSVGNKTEKVIKITYSH